MRKLIFLGVFFLSAASAHGALNQPTFIIPSPFKVDRKGHASGAAAAWNSQNLAGGSYEGGTVRYNAKGSPENKEESKDFSAYTFQHYSSATFEAVFSKENKEDDESPSTETDITSLALRVGGQVPNTLLALGVDYASDKEDATLSGTTATEKSRQLTLSSTYKLQDTIYLGFGLIQDKYEPDTGADDDDDSFYVGTGYTKDGLAGELVLFFENEDGEKTQTLIAQIAKSVGCNQIVGQLIHFTIKNDGADEKFTQWVLTGGYHFDLGSFYVQPELGYRDIKTEDPTSNVDNVTVLASVEAGIRSAAYNVYLSFAKEQSDSDYSGGGGFESDTSTIRIGAHAYF